MVVFVHIGTARAEAWTAVLAQTVVMPCAEQEKGKYRGENKVRCWW